MKRTLLHYAEKLKKPLHILAAFAVIICTAFSVPVFADDTPNFTGQPFVVGSQTGNVLDFYTDNVVGSYNNSINIVFGTLFDDTYAFTYNNGFYVVWDSSFVRPNFGLGLQTNNAWTAQDARTSSYDETTSLRYVNIYSYESPWSFTIPNFSTLNDGLAAVRDYIDNGGGDAPSVWVNKPLVIPQGYTAVINTSNMTAGKGGFRLRANTGNLGNSNLWRDIFGNDNVQSGQAIYNTNTPVSSYDFDDYPQLTWSPYEYSLLRATAYEYIGEATKANTYTYIFNPIQGNATSIKNGQNTNSYITLYMNDAFDGTVKLYPLTSMSAVGQGQTIDVGNDESENAGNGDISNGTWTNGDGNVFTPPQGGGNGTGSSQNPLEAIAGTVEHLGEVLNQFVAGLSTILTAPVEAIQTLINNGSAFVSQLSGLYSWLPTQVYSTLTSAIILCITVGVLKVLL